MKKNETSSPHESDEIDLLELAKTSWENRKTILIIVFVFLILGLFTAFSLEKEYTAGSIFVPQTSEPGKIGGGLGGLASLAGINLSGMSSSSEIPPTLYPKIISSVNFKKEILKSKINAGDSQVPITYEYYFDSLHNPGFFKKLLKYSVGLPGVILKSIKGPNSLEGTNPYNLISISDSEFEHFKRMENQISINHNEKEGFVTLSFTMPEPVMAAQMAIFAEELLQKEVIEYKIQNAREQLKFTESRYIEKKDEFETIQNKLASFRDRNQNLSSAIVLNQLEKLESEYNFSFNIYTELAKQLEQSKLQVSQNTPVFSVIQPVTIPIEKSAPKRPLILFIFVMLGIIASFGYVFGKEFLKVQKENWALN